MGSLTRRRRLALLALLLSGSLDSVPAGQAAQTTPTFRGGTELVAVDFIALTRDGRPVTNLRPESLTLKVDGRVHPIRDLQFIRVAGDTPRPALPGGSTALPLPYGTNEAGAIGRTVILVFDANRIRPGNERSAKEAASRFLDRLSPQDRVGLETESRVNVDLTTDHERVRTALKGIVGHGVADAEIAPNGRPVQQAGAATNWLGTLLAGLKNIDGPKTVVLISEGVPAIKPMFNQAGGPPAPRQDANYQEIARQAGAVRAQVYIIQPSNFAIGAGSSARDLRIEPDPMTGEHPPGGDFQAEEQSKLAGLEDLAAMTGGQLFRLSGDADPIFQQILQQSAAYYLLGFEPNAAERNGKSHQIEIRAAQPGVTIRARPAFTIPKPAAKGAAGPTPAQMLIDTKAYREIPLRAAAYSARGAANGAVSVVVVAESIDTSIPLADISFGLVDAASHRMTAAWPAPAIADGRAVSGTATPPGAYRLRVAATTRDGRRGTVEYDFVAGLVNAAPLELGDLMLGEGRTDGTFAPVLDFSDRATATGYVELYGALSPGTTLSVSFELAATPGGPPLLTIPGVVGPTSTSDRWVARGVVPVGSLPPGDYVARAVVAVNSAVAGRAVRALRKSR